MSNGEYMRKGKYGVDAPYVPIGYVLGGLLALGLGVANALTDGFATSIVPLVVGVLMLLCAGIYLHTTFRGKFRIWADVIDRLGLAADARVLDLGCGRGAVLLMAAERLGEHGRAVGIDLWRSVDQSGNSTEATLKNAEAEGVADRIELRTGDMTELPFADESFDVVVSSLAIHNIKDPGGRETAVREAVRVLKPGGRLAFADLRVAREYAKTLTDLSMQHVSLRRQGWRGWWSGPWVTTRLVTATKPARR